MALEYQDSGPAALPPLGQGVGALLRETRQRLSQDLTAVAEQLRIRQPYLQAIEDGRHQDLPGSTYAIGFVRGYAEYLGLDSDEIVRRFKQEMGGGYGNRTELSFPSAMSESSLPGPALLVGALVLAGVAFAAWYWHQGYADSAVEAVADLPDRLAALIHQPVGGGGGEALPPGTEAVKGVPVAGMPREEVVPPSEEDNSPAANPPAALPAMPMATAAPQPVAGPAEPAKPPVEPARIEQTKLSDTKSLTDLKKLESKPIDTIKPAEMAKPAETQPTPGGTAPDETASASSSGVGDASASKLGGGDHAGAAMEDEKPSRVSLRAEEDCWIDIRDSSGQLVVSRLLHKGETFAVPGRPGLKLTAGNAGALAVQVDGANSQMLGRRGTVRRDVSLEPDRVLHTTRPSRGRRPANPPPVDSAPPSSAPTE